MNKVITTADIRVIGAQLFGAWDSTKDQIKLSGKNLYALIALKKTVEAHLMTVEETLMALSTQFDGEPQANGSIIIPPERREEANKAFFDFGKETVDIEYKQITIGRDDNIPVGILEAVFDFVTFEE